MIPRRFYVLAVCSAFALLSFFFFFLNRNEAILSVPASVTIPNSWKSGLGLGSGSGSDATEPQGAGAGVTEGENTGSAGIDDEQPAHLVPPPASSTDEETARPSAYDFPPLKPLPEHIDIAILDTTGKTEEVAAAFIHAFGVQPNANISIYLKKQRFGIDSIIKKFNFSTPVVVDLPSSKFHHELHSGYHPSIVVATNCEADLLNIELAFAELLAFQKTYLFCVVHNPEQWKDTHLTSRIRPWMDAHMVDFITLSQHTAQYFRTETLDTWDFNATMNLRHMPPLFPVDLSEKDTDANQAEHSISVYGDHDDTGHDYTDILASLTAVQEAAENVTAAADGAKAKPRKVSLNVFADGTDLVVPAAIEMSVHTEADPKSLLSMYKSVSESFILLPAFAAASEEGEHSDYLTKLASWTVPLSLITGVPIASSDDLFEAYHYLPRDATWFRFKDSEMELAERVVAYNATEIAEKKAVVRKTAAGLIHRNVEHVDYWIQLAMMRVQKAAWEESDSQELA